MIVFLHGWGMNKVIFNDFIAEYLPQKQVLQLDLPNYGVKVYEEDFDAQVRALKQQIPANAHLIAWSLGGLYALRMAALFPEHLERLTLVCSTPSFVQRESFSHALTFDLLDQFSEQLLLDRDKTIERFLLLQLHGQKNIKEIVKHIRNKISHEKKVEKKDLLFGLNCLKRCDCRKDLQKARIPVDFILGARDRLVPKQVAEDIIELKVSLKVKVLEKAAHLPFITHSQEFYEAVFLET